MYAFHRGGETNPLIAQDMMLRQQREQIFKQQDEIVLEIGQGVDRLHRKVIKSYVIHYP
jgi:hypothetical protein